MALKFKEQKQSFKPFQTTNNPFVSNEYQVQQIGLPFPPLGLPFGIQRIGRTSKIIKKAAPAPISMPGANLKRAINFNADYGGCGAWRMTFPELLLNLNSKMIVNSLTTMVTDPRFYLTYSAVKLQRQATPIQLEFVKMLKNMGEHSNLKILYEVDDIVFDEDIPKFNRCREAFTAKEIRNSIEEMISMCDEMTVVSEYMRDYYKSKTNNKKISCIPNYSPKFWFGNKYNKENLLNEYEKNKKRPRILATPSGTHFDVLNATNQKDDYSHIIQAVARSRKDYKWVFMGAFPILLKPFIDCGDIEFIPWAELMQYPEAILNSKAQVTIAALEDNNFNWSKSEIKFTEACYLGIPSVLQKSPPYKNAFHQFDTGDEMLDHIKTILKDSTIYEKECKKAFEYGNTMYLDDHLDEHVLTYTTPFGDPTRKNNITFYNNNCSQF